MREVMEMHEEHHHHEHDHGCCGHEGDEHHNHGHDEHDHKHEEHEHECHHDHDHEGHGCEGHDHDHEGDEHGHHHDHDHEGHEEEHHHDHECCHHEHGHEGHHHHHYADEVFTSWGLETPSIYSKEEIEHILEELDKDSEYGLVLRAKGMVPSTDGSWIYFDYVPEERNVRSGKPDVTGKFCVIGSKLQEEKLAALFQK